MKKFPDLQYIVFATSFILMITVSSCSQFERTDIKHETPIMTQDKTDSIWNSVKPEPIDENMSTTSEAIQRHIEPKDSEKFGTELESESVPFAYVGLSRI